MYITNIIINSIYIIYIYICKIYYRFNSTSSNRVGGDRDIFTPIFSVDGLGIAAAFYAKLELETQFVKEVFCP